MFTEQQEKLREKDEVKIVRQWCASSFAYGADSKQRTPNPDAHPTICQREDGKYCDVEGRLIPVAKVPKYIIEQGKPPRHPKARGPITMDLADAMTDAMTPADPSDRRARKAPAKRGKSAA